MKGIVLAGGTGSRLWPITKGLSKQLLPIYDKPMIYYPISTLMLAGIKEILIITTPQDQIQFKNLLGSGSQFGVTFFYEVQSEPKGIAQALLIGEDFLGGESCLMILGDNVFHGAGLGREIARVLPHRGAHVFTYEVPNPNQFGVLEVAKDGKPITVTEKPTEFISNLAVTGLYFFDHRVSEFAKKVSPSSRGELEITSVISLYIEEETLTYTKLSRGSVWLDTGNPSTLSDASMYVRVIEERTGFKIGCLEEIAWKNNWLSDSELEDASVLYGNNQYGGYLRGLLK